MQAVGREIAFELDVVDIAGDPELEAAHRASLPVVEVDGRAAFTYVIVPSALRRMLA